LGQLKSTLYARMEEVSFRSGAVVAGGVLTAAVPWWLKCLMRPRTCTVAPSADQYCA
jgi:hypothetical protein